jgi:hypothetical protein
MRYDTTALLTEVARMAKIPQGSTYRDADTLLAIANSEMEQWVVPAIIEVAGGHLMAYEDTAMVSGQSRYRFPARAIRPERITIVDSDGKRVGKLHLASGDMVDKVIAGAEGTTSVDTGAFGEAHGFWVPENNHAVVVLQTGVDSTGRSLRIYYRRQPNQLIATTSCWLVTNVSGPTLELEPIGSDADHSITDGEEYDLLAGSPSYEAIAEDLEALATNVNILELGSEPEASEGDIVAPAGYSPVPQVPIAFWGVLTAHITAGVLLEMGEGAKSQQWRDIAAAKLEKVMATATPRSEEAETAAQDHWD